MAASLQKQEESTSGIILTREDEHHFRHASLVWRIQDFGKLWSIAKRDREGPQGLWSRHHEVPVVVGHQGQRPLKMHLNLNWNRTSEELKDHLTVFLSCHPLLDKDGKVLPMKIATEFIAAMGSKTITKQGSLDKTWSVFDDKKQDWGSSNFVKKNQMEEDVKAHGMNEVLVITCNLSILCNGPALPPPPSVPTSLSLAEQMWASRDEAEITIICPVNVKCKHDQDDDNGKDGAQEDEMATRSFQCHKDVLCSRSKVFAAMFNHEETPEKQSNTIKIKDIDAKTMEQFVEFLYRDTCPALHAGVGEIDVMVKLLVAADKYDVGPMKNCCERRLVGAMSFDTFVDLSNLAANTNGELLLAAAVDFAAAHFDKVVSRRGWEEMDRKVLDGILSAVHALRLTL